MVLAQEEHGYLPPTDMRTVMITSGFFVGEQFVWLDDWAIPPGLGPGQARPGDAALFPCQILSRDNPIFPLVAQTPVFLSSPTL